MDTKDVLIERIKVMEKDCLLKENSYCQGMVEGLKIALHLILKSENEERLLSLGSAIKADRKRDLLKIH